MKNRKLRKINESSFTIEASGAMGPPASALRDYLLKRGAKRVITISHPLVPEGSNQHIIKDYDDNKVTEKHVSRPNKPPYTYPFDPFVPLRLPKTTAWFGFNNLAAMRGLVRRKQGKTKIVCYWAIDFVVDRFGKGLATKVYDKVDRYVCRKVDARVELSKVGITGRNKHLGLTSDSIAPSQVVPMGSWFDKTPKITKSAWERKTIVYLGHLTERQGVDTFIQSIKILTDQGYKIKAEIIGSGPAEASLKALASSLSIDKQIKFHGFVKSHEEVDAILASGFVAAAPYVKSATNFVQFTDAGKLKSYLGAGLPIVLTDVPNNARSLEKAGAAVVADDNPKAFAAALETLVKDKKKWQQATNAALKVAKEFDWEVLLKKALFNIGFEG